MSGEVESILSRVPKERRNDFIKAGLKEIYNDSLLALCNGPLGYKDVNEHTHGDVIRALESSTRRKLICIPRGCLKSSIACVAYPIRRINRNPNDRTLITSELYTNSKTFIREIKQHLETRKLTKIFGEYRTEPWNEGEITVRQRTKPLKEASITAGGIGTTKVGQHYDCIICDDLNSPDNTNTPENAAKIISYYKYLISILEPDGTLLIIGTRYSQLDVIGHILETLNLNDSPRSGEYEVA